MIRLAPAKAADVDDLVALATEMDVFYGDVRPDPRQQWAEEIIAVLFGVPPAAFALLARDNADKLVGFAAYSFLWPAVGLSTSLTSPTPNQAPATQSSLISVRDFARKEWPLRGSVADVLI